MTAPARFDTAGRDDMIVRLTRDGLSAPRIAEVVGVGERTVQRVRRHHGIAQRVPEVMSEEEIRLAAALLDDGASYGEVSRTLGRSDSTIRKKLCGRSVWKVGGGIECLQYFAALDAIAPPIKCQVAS